jgi:hypothetical protein
MLRTIGNSRNAKIIIVLWLIVSLIMPLCFTTPTEAAPSYVKQGDSVYNESNGTYIKVTPHTLTSSGWVTVNFSTSKFIGDVDVSFGFNGVDQVKVVKSESWETYDKVDKGKPQTVTDWKPLANQATKEAKDYQGAKKWESTKHSQKVEKDKLYSVRFWVDLPFNGLNKVTGKYNVAIKPSNLSMEQAVAQNQIAILDPWYDSSWGYRKQFTVTGSTAGAQTNYQVKINVMYGAGADMTGLNQEPAIGSYTADAGTSTIGITDSQLTSAVDDFYIGCTLYNITRALTGTVTDYAGATKTANCTAIAGQVATDTYYIIGRVPTIWTDSKCATDFDDIRFTKSDGTTLLDAWLESSTASSIATIWVELDTLPASPATNTFYIYYGNSTVASNWSMTNTFIFADDFLGTTLDTTKWTAAGAGTATVAGGTVSLVQKDITSTGSVVTSGSVTTFYAKQTVFNVDFNIWEIISPGSANYAGYAMGLSFPQFVWNADDTATLGWIVTAIAGDAAWRRWEIGWLSNYILIYKCNGVIPNNAYTTDVTYVASDLEDVFVQSTAALSGIEVDYVHVRRFCMPEPVVTAWATTETTGGLASVLSINNAKVFSGYLETNDWLITCLYLNKYEPYYTNANDVQQLFYIQLYSVDGLTLLAQTKCPEWGFKPGAIYLSAAQASSLEWGLAYIVRVYGDFAGYPYVTYTLTPTDWLGADLTRLDSWIRSTAGLMETYYGGLGSALVLTTYITGRGLVLNEEGGATFNTNIPALAQVRPGLFQIVVVTPGYTHQTFTQTYSPGTWQVLLGATIANALTNFGSSMSLSGDMVGAFLGFTFYVVVAALCFPAGSAVAAISIPSVILVTVWYVGLIPMAAMGFVLAVMAFFLLWQFWGLKNA